ncbi:MAG: hypothetical protein NUV63_08935 [Gallionella sp.]|nr:hypothetical protein [Gallionella sp.]
MTEREASFTTETLKQLLHAVSEDVVLIGGQALSFWVNYYSIDLSPHHIVGAISRDADFLGERKDVKHIADGVSGKTIYPSEHEMTAIAGQVVIRLDQNEYLNIDVIHRVVGIDANAVRKRALQAEFDGVSFRVMHPLDVLKSRIENLATLQDKQTPEGITQANLALQVANKFITTIADNIDGQKSALKAIEAVVNIAKTSAGCKCARGFGIDFFQAIPKNAIKDEQFHQMRWPHLVKELDKCAGN